MNIVETKGLTKRYGKLLAVDNLDMNIPKKSVYGLLGPNGAGKTTTLGMCTTLIKPTKGDVIICGYSISKSPDKVRRCIGLLPQDSEFYAHRTALDHLILYGKLSGLSKPKDKAQEMLHKVSLAERMDSKTRELSHGMRQLLGIAQAFLAEPEVVFLDEPISGLDPRVAYQIKGLIKKYSKKTTIIMSSHYLEAVEQLCSHIGILKDGRLVKEGEINKIKKGKSLEKVFLELA